MLRAVAWNVEFGNDHAAVLAALHTTATPGQAADDAGGSDHYPIWFGVEGP